MDERICHASLVQLIHYVEGATSMHMLFQTTRQYIKPVAKECHIGRLVFHYMAPESGFSPEGSRMEETLYEAETGYDKAGEKKHLFSTKEGGSLSFDISPEAGYVWDKQQEENILFVAQILYILFGRSRMNGLLDYYRLTDHLTGVSNVVGLTQHMGRLIATGMGYQFTGMFINLKNFRYVNQVAGSVGGDIFLKVFTGGIKALLEEDEVLSRLGGDNFLLVVKNPNTGKILSFLEEYEIQLMVNNEERSFKVDTRMGIYSMKSGDTIADLMTYTNAAFQVAKKSGQGDWVRFQPSMIRKINHDKDVVQSFPKALLAREFQVYYQPKVDLHTGKLIGSEALARWIQDGKVIPPIEFVPSLEQDGSICQLDFYVLEQVCRTLRKWMEEGIDPVPVSVNFSRMHFHNRNMGYDILDTLERFDIDPKYIEIEMTELYEYENYTSMLKFISFMAESGIKVSVDDFGTGYSSLAMLANLNADTIKIDKSFLDKLQGGTARDKVLVKDIISLIRDMEIATIAEGVETKEQMLFLREMGCMMGQGYLFDKPLPLDEYEKRQKDRDIYRHIFEED